MADFSQYGGPSDEWLAVAEKSNVAFRGPDTDPIALQKSVNDGREAVSAKELVELAPQLSIKTYTVPTRDGSSIEARTYRPLSQPADAALPVYLHLHGGGFIFGTLSSEDAASARAALGTGFVVFNVNYRHTPEHTFPTAWNDAQDAFAWLHDHASELSIDPKRVVVGGISAGGQLTASLVLEQHLGKALTKYPKPAGQILLIPALANHKRYKETVLSRLQDPSKNSYDENKDAPIIPRKTIDFFTALLKYPQTEPNDTKINIVAATAEEVKGFPPTVFGIAGLDPLRDEALLYAKTLVDAGVPTDITVFKGVPHGFRRFGAALKASEHWDEVIVKGLLWAVENPVANKEFEVKVK